MFPSFAYIYIYIYVLTHTHEKYTQLLKLTHIHTHKMIPFPAASIPIINAIAEIFKMQLHTYITYIECNYAKLLNGCTVIYMYYLNMLHSHGLVSFSHDTYKCICMRMYICMYMYIFSHFFGFDSFLSFTFLILCATFYSHFVLWNMHFLNLTGTIYSACVSCTYILGGFCSNFKFN